MVAVRAEQTEILVSRDGGASFEARTPPDVPLDVAFDPADPARMVVATAQGTYSSADGGGSWRPRDPTETDQLAWGPGGEVKRSTDGGATWKRLLRLQ